MYVSIDCASQELEVWRLDRSAGDRPAIAGGPVDVQQAEPLREELLDFVAAIREGRLPRVTGADGRRALALATTIKSRMRD
jgi:predicted dehydrogenase